LAIYSSFDSLLIPLKFLLAIFYKSKSNDLLLGSRPKAWLIRAWVFIEGYSLAFCYKHPNYYRACKALIWSKGADPLATVS
jgi:hypothetical protein